MHFFVVASRSNSLSLFVCDVGGGVSDEVLLLGLDCKDGVEETDGEGLGEVGDTDGEGLGEGELGDANWEGLGEGELGEFKAWGEGWEFRLVIQNPTITAVTRRLPAIRVFCKFSELDRDIEEITCGLLELATFLGLTTTVGSGFIEV